MDWKKATTAQKAKFTASRRERYRIRKMVLDKLKNQPCMDCGVNYPPYVMDYDHRDPSIKLASVSTLLQSNMNMDVVLAEIEKCDLVCANCHRIRHHSK